MKVLHEAEQPGSLVLARIFESFPGAGLRVVRLRHPVALHTGVGQLPLRGGQPVGGQRRVGEHPEAHDGDEARDGTFDDEQPAPAGEPPRPVQTPEDAGGDEAREPGGEDLGTVEECYACRDLCDDVGTVKSFLSFSLQ